MSTSNDDDPDKHKQDWELDFTRKDNVDRIIEKYESAQNTRINYVPEIQIRTLQVMEVALKNNKDRLIDIVLLLIKAYLSNSKNMPSGYLIRNVWITLCTKIGELIDLLETKGRSGNKQEEAKEDDGLDDLERFMKYEK